MYKYLPVSTSEYFMVDVCGLFSQPEKPNDGKRMWNKNNFRTVFRYGYKLRFSSHN